MVLTICCFAHSYGTVCDSSFEYLNSMPFFRKPIPGSHDGRRCTSMVLSATRCRCAINKIWHTKRYYVDDPVWFCSFEEVVQRCIGEPNESIVETRDIVAICQTHDHPRRQADANQNCA